MTTKKLSNEEKIIDLLEKSLILQLLNSGVKRDDIKKILAIGSEKISPIIGAVPKKEKINNGK